MSKFSLEMNTVFNYLRPFFVWQFIGVYCYPLTDFLVKNSKCHVWIEMPGEDDDPLAFRGARMIVLMRIA